MEEKGSEESPLEWKYNTRYVKKVEALPILAVNRRGSPENEARKQRWAEQWGRKWNWEAEMGGEDEEGG